MFGNWLKYLNKTIHITLFLLLNATHFAVNAQDTQPSPSAPPALSPATEKELSSADTNREAEKKTAPPRPGFKPLRYEEDWSVLKDEANRTDYADSLKYISLGRENFYLSIGGTARFYYENYRNENFGSVPTDKNGWLLQRYMVHADWHFGKRVRVFSELKSGIINNRLGGARPPDKDLLDVHQLFVDYKFTLGKQKSPIVLRFGRQEFNFGSSRLLTFREGPNVRQSFDAARISAKIEKWTLDGFVSKPVETSGGFFDDAAIGNQTLWGVYAVRPAPLLSKKGAIDVYYFGLDRKRARFNQGFGREIRHSVGTRIWNAQEKLDYNFELIYQFGTFGRGRINAWTVASDTGYTLKNVRFNPRFGVKANITSGDRDPNNPDLQTFNALFPKGGYFGQIAAVGPYNHTDVHPSVNLRLTKKVELVADYVWFWRTSIRDGVYGVPGNLLKPGNLSRRRFVGQQINSELRVQLDKHTNLNFAFARFFAGGFLRETPPAKDINYLAAWITYKF
ncbi:MAG: alginate export family protein [Acidobacteriota bacterium]|nr:alginate export family protein [Acidobacteriota bacterium]